MLDAFIIKTALVSSVVSRVDNSIESIAGKKLHNQ
jgi:hypothetical protein